MTEYTEVAIVGGGQAGLALSYYLTQQGRPHVVLEQGQIGETWRSQRWDSFNLVTPNWMNKLPGFEYNGDDSDGFFRRDDVVNYLEAYARSFHTPIQCGVRVTSVRPQPSGQGYLLETDDRTIGADNIVLATGPYQKAKLPPGSDTLPASIRQVAASEYRNPEALSEGAVLVVGTGQSGFQIAEELHDSGRQVYLSTSGCARTPFRYRGHDVIWWLTRIGFFDRTIDQLPSPMAKFGCSPHVSSKHGGKDINLPQFARQGMILLGHLERIQGQQVTLAPDLQQNVAKAEAFATQVKLMIDGFIAKMGIDAPVADAADDLPSAESLTGEPIVTLDLSQTAIRTIIWATGHTLDFRWVHVPVFDETGYPIHQRGVTAYPGLYFLGLHWLYKQKSALLYGTAEDAAYIAAAIASAAAPVNR